MKKMNNILKMIAQMDANANEVKLAQHEVKLASIDKFRSEYNKIQSGNTTKYIEQIQAIRTNVLKGIEQVGTYNEKIQKTIIGLKSLGLTDEIKDFEFLKNDIQNDFDELVFINDKLKSIL
jgi:hypothetical protein